MGDLLQDARARLWLERRAENLAPFAVTRQLADERRCDHHLVEPINDLLAGARLAKPPGRDVRQRKRTAQQRGRQRRQPLRASWPGLEDGEQDQLHLLPGAEQRRVHQVQRLQVRGAVRGGGRP